MFFKSILPIVPLFLFFLSFLFLDSCFSFFLWFMMEMFTSSFIFFCFWYSIKSMLVENLFFYLILQEILSFFLLSSMIFSNIFFFNESLMSILFDICILFKMGLYPLSFWIFHLSSSMGFGAPLVIFLTIMKMPMYMIFYSHTSMMLLLTMVFNFILGSLFIGNSMNLLDLLVSSSVYNTFLFYCVLMLDYSYFLFTFLFYTVLMTSLMSGKNKVSLSTNRSILAAVSISLMSLVPINFFFVKILMMNLLFNLNFMTFMVSLLICILFPMSYYFYYKIFSLSLTFSDASESTLFSMNYKMVYNKFLFLFFFIFSFIFFI